MNKKEIFLAKFLPKGRKSLNGKDYQGFAENAKNQKILPPKKYSLKRRKFECRKITKVVLPKTNIKKIILKIPPNFNARFRRES